MEVLFLLRKNGRLYPKIVPDRGPARFQRGWQREGSFAHFLVAARLVDGVRSDIRPLAPLRGRLVIGRSGGLVYGFLLLSKLLQAIHVHILPRAPFAAGSVSQPGRATPASGHSDRWEAAHRTAPTTNLTHDPFQRVVRADLAVMLVGEGIAGQRLLDALTRLLDGLMSLHRLQPGHYRLGLLPCGLSRSSWAWIALSIATTCLTLPLGTTEKTSR
jgi:hypothetical protein